MNTKPLRFRAKWLRLFMISMCVAAAPALHGTDRAVLERDGFIVTFPSTKRAEAEFLMGLLVESQHRTGSVTLQELGIDEPRLFRSVANRLGFDEVPAGISAMWEKQLQMPGSILGGRPAGFNLVAIDLWDADDFSAYLKSGPVEFTPRGATLVHNVSPRLQVVIDLTEGSIQYVHLSPEQKDDPKVYDIRIPVIIRPDDSLDESRTVIRDSLEIPGFIPGAERRGSFVRQTFLRMIHELAEAAFVQEISRAEDRRWIAEGVATWVALEEALRLGFIENVEAGLPLLWREEDCHGRQITAQNLYAWPPHERHVETPGELCLYATSARVFAELARVQGKEFVSEWFRDVCRSPYAERTLATFEQSFAEKTGEPLEVFLHDFLSRLQEQGKEE